MLRAYVLAVKLLVVVALPLATVGWALSYLLIGLLGGSQYLPHAAWVLRAMVWYMPLGFINSVTQYVLISLNQQRFLTWAFLVGLGFTLVANVVLIRQFGYMASAYVAIASELALLIPFAVGVRRHLAAIPWLRMLWKPVLCAAPMIALWAALPQRLGFVGLLLGGLVYTLGLGLLRAFDPQERHALRSVLPWDRMTRWMEGLRSHG
ncbi:MAG: hypothetical protein FJZ90_13290 [Chloroflexi bacterium]|nr:hypothetical protein [Chloroflexota bacterium]